MYRLDMHNISMIFVNLTGTLEGGLVADIVDMGTLMHTPHQISSGHMACPEGSRHDAHQAWRLCSINVSPLRCL